jgi:cephalosporin hydroxylase
MGTDIENTLKQFSQLGLFSHNPHNGIGLWTEEQELLLTLVGESKKYLEIGSHNLGSALLVEEHARTNGLEREIFGLDIEFSPWAKLNYKRANSSIKMLECDSNELRQHHQELQGLDFVFIDGFHSFNQVLHDFEAVQDLVVDGGIVAFHDTSPNLNKPSYVDTCWEFASENFGELASTERGEDFYVDEAIVFIMRSFNKIKDMNWSLIDCTIECYHPQETRLQSWIRGKTSPHSAIWAMKVDRSKDED